MSAKGEKQRQEGVQGVCGQGHGCRSRQRARTGLRMKTKSEGRGPSSWTPEDVGGPCLRTAGEKGSFKGQAGPSGEKTEGL